ncbi:hypothetical protein [Bartonella sp. B17]
MTVSSVDLTQQDQSKIFAHMVALIQDEIDDTTAEYSIQIQDSIFTALRLCKRENFFFNDKIKPTFNTQSGKIWYGQQEGLFIRTEKDIEAMFLGKNPTTQTQLIYETPKVLKKKYGTNPPQGTPFFYTCVDQKIGLFPTPKMSDTVRFSYASARFGEENIMLEDDPWMLYAFDLIKARAKYELYKNILKDPEYAAVSFNDFQEQLKALHIETSRKKGSSKIIPMGF